MFDYQAGEKYRLTLIMVGMAGIMAGMFFTLMFMSDPQPARAARRSERRANNPGVMTADGRYATDGVNTLPPGIQGQPVPQQPGVPQPPIAPASYTHTDGMQAMQLIEQWLPMAWDLSAGSAPGSQEKAIAHMTPECASLYRQNIWTPEIAQSIQESGIQSTFKASDVKMGGTKPDGAVIIFVTGEQVLMVPGKPARSRPVKLEYLVKQTPEGLRIAGISEGNNFGS